MHVSEAVAGREARPPLLGSSQALAGGKVGTRVPDLLILQKMLEIPIFMGKLPTLKERALGFCNLRSMPYSTEKAVCLFPDDF